VPVTQATKERCPALTAISFDPGFHSPGHQTELAKRVERVVSAHAWAASTPPSSPRSMPWNTTVWTAAPIVASTGSSATSPSPYWPATSSVWARY
jgi:hypothetical protein